LDSGEGRGDSPALRAESNALDHGLPLGAIVHFSYPQLVASRTQIECHTQVKLVVGREAIRRKAAVYEESEPVEGKERGAPKEENMGELNGIQFISILLMSMAVQRSGHSSTREPENEETGLASHSNRTGRSGLRLCVGQQLRQAQEIQHRQARESHLLTN